MKGYQQLESTPEVCFNCENWEPKDFSATVGTCKITGKDTYPSQDCTAEVPDILVVLKNSISPEGTQLSDLLAAAKEAGVGWEEAVEQVKTLKMRGDIYEPTPGVLKVL